MNKSFDFFKKMKLNTKFGTATNSSNMKLGDNIEKATSAATETVEKASQGDNNLLRRVLPIILILGLGYLGWTYFIKTEAGKAAGKMVLNAKGAKGDSTTVDKAILEYKAIETNDGDDVWF